MGSGETGILFFMIILNWWLIDSDLCNRGVIVINIFLEFMIGVFEDNRGYPFFERNLNLLHPCLINKQRFSRIPIFNEQIR